MINKVLFIQPFVLENEHLTDEILVWEVYLENFLKSKVPNLLFDLIYLPVEQSRGDFHLETYKDKEAFNSQMDKLVSSINFELDKNTLICISGTTSHHYLSSKIIAEYFQDFFPFTIIVFGGAHASARPKDFSYTDSPIDYVIIGEGEIPLYNFIKNTPKKQNTPIILKNNPIQNIDDLPPLDLSIFDKYIEDFKHLSISLSRGCPFNCNFCMENNLLNSEIKFKRWRVYSPKRAIKEVDTMIKYGLNQNIKEYGFYDPIFGLNKKWLDDFLDLYDFPEISYSWIETRLDILNEELIQKLSKKNFYSMFGLESYSKKMLSIMNKAVNPKEYLNKFEKIAQIYRGLERLYALNILSNHPGETRESYLETFNRLEKLTAQDNSDSVFLNIRFYHHFPGTHAYNNFKFYNENFGSVCYFPEWWKHEELLRFGPYGIRSSSELSLRQSIDLFNDLAKSLGLAKLGRLKILKPKNLLQKILLIKKELKGLEHQREMKINFLDEKNIESHRECLTTTI